MAYPWRGAATRVVAVGLVLVALLCAASAASAEIVADSGFRPNPDGFSFRNYAKSEANLSAAQLELLYGHRVCAFVRQPEGCVLTPPAQVTLNKLNEDMNNGHCYGFATLSLLLYRHLWPPFGPGPPYGLKLAGSASLERSIAYAWAWQTLPAIESGVVKATPKQVLRSLISLLSRRSAQPYVLAFLNRTKSGGHAVTPYAVDALGRGRFDILVYDNNHPGVERRVHVNTRTDTWSYELAANPRNPESLWDGDAGTKSLLLYPVVPGLGVHPCPFCAPEGRPTPTYNELQLEGNPRNHAHLLIVDRRGRRLGFVRGHLVSEIPGGHAVSQLLVDDWRERPEPIYRVPPGLDLKVMIDGRGLHAPDYEHLSFVGPAHDAVIDKIRIQPGEVNVLTLSGSAATISYRSAPGQTESPTFDIGLAGSSGDFRFTLASRSLTPSSTVRASLDRTHSTLTFADVGHARQTFSIRLTRYISDRVKPLKATQVRLAPGFEAVARYGSLQPGQVSVPVVIRRAGP
jgi:hypothetical protein